MSQLTFAQNATTPVVTQKVSYSRTLPKSLASFLPSAGKSRFWGASNLTYNGQKIWLHVYDLGKTRFNPEDENTDGKQDSVLDIFIMSRAKRLQKLSSTRFTYNRFGGYKRGGIYESVALQTLWLDPRTKKTPIVQIAFQDPNALYGTMKNYVFAVFANGLDKPATTQRGFGQGASNAADWNVWDTSFEVDERRLLVIVFSEHRMVYIRDTRFHWTGSAFKPYRRTLSEMSDEPQEPQVLKDEPVIDPLDDPANYSGP